METHSFHINGSLYGYYTGHRLIPLVYSQVFLAWAGCWHNVEIPQIGDPASIWLGVGATEFCAQFAELWLDVADQSYWTASVCTGFNLCLLCSKSLPVSEKEPQHQNHFFHEYPKYHLMDTNNIYKNPYKFETWTEPVRQMLMKLEASFI